MKRILLFAFSFTLLAFCSNAQPNNSDAEYVKANYTKYEYQIPMRDGKKLFTSVYVPKDQSKKYPIMMDRTPYSVAPYGADRYKGSLGPSSLFLHDGFIFVYQDVRGRWMSEGTFEEMTPEKEVHKTKNDVDEGTDTYDTIDWLIKNIKNNNGKVGVWGISYPGFFTTASLLSRHPALAAASPQAPMADLYRDDAFHNGAFMLAANFGFYPFFTNRQDDKPTQRQGGRLNYGTADGYEFYMNMGAVKNSNDKYYKDTIRLWNEMLDHPDYDQHWKDRNVLYHLHDIKTPTLVTGGWYDAEDLYGAINTYKTLKKENPNTPIYFTMGPWVHGGWSRGDGDHLGDVDFGGPTGPFYRDKIEFAFFSHYLKGTELDLKPVSAFETGVNQWKTYNTWPPKEAEDKNLYLLPGGKLSFDAPAGDKDTFDEYTSDPDKPVPFIDGIDLGMKREYMVGDQRFAARRPDVLTYQTDVLDHDITLAGNIWANLKVAITGTDADWVVKVIDVYPDSAKNNKFTAKGTYMSNYEQMVRSEAMRGKFRNDFGKPEAFVPGQVTPVNFELQDVLHTFKKGHRIMVQVQSTWFPLIDRNTQQFQDIMKAKDTDFKKETHKVYTSKEHPSYLKVRVME
ncbi:CocE/NonD family hydrolase [Mucilaginibacter ginsenosidivorans]|uniref:CocE/NonD family hydrolase n=1 Tax=Mucilaginibacter ginsenosidivorans TaxID=398053 RepID=A0A5B8UVI5_9SPHI|nr:CocE/NonD family hydrolase [Mucilaginibacter ginsenosidivorans]QEC63074.1 CocE/NonD family hydrolase [Mucilaginibacter ginsenosidivorans]